mmetsp:Transcript_4959/g.7520  ORF Transcript_4959/g.7520 Transcript_4959/m.7520 type:complete len:127 (+) Transcript_4959:180-560(+)
MKLFSAATVLVSGIAVGTTFLSSSANAFSSPASLHNNYFRDVRERQRIVHAVKLLATNDAEDCGCGTPMVLSGDPSSKARSLNPREAIRKSTFYTVNGEKTSIDKLVGEPQSDNGVSIVVLLRSFG